MKKNFKYLLSLPLLALGMVACSEEGPVNGPQGPQNQIQDPVYMTFNVETPSTRSMTQEDGQSEDGTLNATAAESKVSELMVVICSADGQSVIDKQLFPSGENTLTGDATSWKATAVYEAGTMKSLFKNKDVKIYMYCNPIAAMKGADAATLRSGKTAVTDNIWTDNKFVMTNVDEYSYKFPGDFMAYKSAANALNLGTVAVQRMAARFDYKAAKADNVYTVVDGDDKSNITVTLTHMALINNSKEAFNLKQTTTQADGYSSPVILGVEKVDNWVVDTDAAFKAAYTGAEATDGNFTEAFMANPSTWKWIALKTNVAAYEFQSYGMENTIPAIAKQMNGISAGVVFRGQLKAGESATEAQKAALQGEETVYIFGNVLYGTWAHVAAYAEAHPTEAVAVAYNKVNKPELVKAEVANAGFTGVTPASKGVFNVLYYYWNRHNDNKIAPNAEGTSMGIMEFGVVRNNVYQLCVNGISRFGHPENPNDPDPDPKDPTTPDEVVYKEYMTVSVNVLPWVKRVNNIEF